MSASYKSLHQLQASGEVIEGLTQFPRDQNMSDEQMGHLEYAPGFHEYKLLNFP